MVELFTFERVYVNETSLVIGSNPVKRKTKLLIFFDFYLKIMYYIYIFVFNASIDVD